MKESFPIQPPQPEQQPKMEEELLAHFRETCEHGHHHAPQGEERLVMYHSFHQDLDSLEEAEIVKRYERGLVPTMSSINLAATEASKALLEEGDPDAARIGKLIQGQASGIRRWCRRYVTTIIQFHTKKKDFRLMNAADQRDALSQADVERRRVHDALLESLRTLTRLIEEGRDHAEYPRPMTWSPTSELEVDAANTKPVIFSESAIQDRDLIKSWAIAADSVEEMKKILGADDFPPGK
jgi:hypothetical protein